MNAPRRIVRRGGFLHGFHVFAGTGFYPRTIVNLRRGGYDDAWIIENYAHVPITSADIAAAVRWGNRPHRLLIWWLEDRSRRPLTRFANWAYARWGGDG